MTINQAEVHPFNQQTKIKKDKKNSGQVTGAF